LARAGIANLVAIADPDPAARDHAGQIADAAVPVASLQELLAADLQGLVIATPSALHAEQSIAALEHGVAVFCQKPLGRTSHETRRVVEAARMADRLLGVDLSYRYTNAMQAIRALLSRGELGRIYAVDLVFHNAYGPDKPWFYDPVLSGGGPVIDLGIHLVDVALWALDFPRVCAVQSRLFSGGLPLLDARGGVEDYAVAQLDLAGGAVVRLACSWRLPAGCDAIFEASFYGTGGGATMRNVNGSFYDFTAERFVGTARETLAMPPDDWGGRAAVEWARRLGEGSRFDARAEEYVRVHEVLDAIYGGRRCAS
jgi:predicted dehydrogenase